jgi:hypothetical protein
LKLHAHRGRFLSFFIVPIGSPFIKQTFDFENKGIPVLYEDEAFQSVLSTIGGVSEIDNVTAILFAVPGAGKSKTVLEAAKRCSAPYHRIKFVSNNTFVLALHEQCNPATIPEEYAVAMKLFLNTCTVYINAMMVKMDSVRRRSDDATVVLHFDEMQLLMGTNIVSSRDPVSSDLFDYAMPAFCDAINAGLTDRNWLKVVLSGTNFFAPLVLNVGSDLKVVPIQLLGRFPEEFVNNLLNAYFSMDEIRANIRDLHVVSLSANRRAIQHLFNHFKQKLLGCNDKSQIESKFVAAANAAYHSWSDPITRALGHSVSRLAVVTMALLSFPEGADGKRSDDGSTITFAELPDDVKQYGLSGALNMHVNGNSIVVHVPTGCVYQFFSESCGKKCNGHNLTQLLAFLTTSQSVVTEKGHAFERMLACELTLGDSKLSSLVARKTSRRLAVDPLSVGREFVYCPTIQTANWESETFKNRVLCVREDPKAQGQRLVDIGFPMIDTNTGKKCKIYCELKDVADQNLLWRQCFTFFSKMEEYVKADCNVVVVFVSFHSFLTHEPQQRPVLNSAHDSREQVNKLLSKNTSQFAIIEGCDMKSMSVFPFSEMHTLIESKKVDVGVKEITDGASAMYVSPAK